MNHKLTTGKPELHPIPVKSPWYQIGIDFVGPLCPEADDGSHYILTISDYFTKSVEVIPTFDNPMHYKVGQLVMKKDFTLVREMEENWKLDFWVHIPSSVLPHGTYKLADPAITDNQGVTIQATGSHLKPYNKPGPTDYQMDKPPIERELPQDDKNSETVSILNRYHDSAFKPSLDHLSIEPLEPAFVGCSFQLEESIPPPPPTSSNAELSTERNLNLSISVENIGQPIFTSSPVIGTQPYSTERNLSLLKDVDQPSSPVIESKPYSTERNLSLLKDLDQHILTSSPVIEKRTNQPSGSMFTRSPVKRKLHFIEKGQNHAAHELMMNVKHIDSYTGRVHVQRMDVSIKLHLHNYTRLVRTYTTNGYFSRFVPTTK